MSIPLPLIRSWGYSETKLRCIRGNRRLWRHPCYFLTKVLYKVDNQNMSSKMEIKRKFHECCILLVTVVINHNVAVLWKSQRKLKSCIKCDKRSNMLWMCEVGINSAVSVGTYCIIACSPKSIPEETFLKCCSCFCTIGAFFTHSGAYFIWDFRRISSTVHTLLLPACPNRTGYHFFSKDVPLSLYRHLTSGSNTTVH